MVNTRTDAKLSVAVQNALQTLLPQIRAEIREEFVPVLDRRILVEILHRSLFILGLNALISKSPVHLRKQQLPWTQRIGSFIWRRSLMSWVVRMHSRLDWPCTSLRVMHLLGGKPISKPKERLKREYHSIRQTDTETSTEFMQRFLRLDGFLGAAADTAEEQAKNFQWGLRRSTLNHLMCIQFTDVAQVANAARNYEILHERDDDDAKRPDKRQRVVIGISRPLNRVVTG
nr:zinc finger, CCHC-type, retrotransposon Gag domain protein [Tanacetum cinerariifolium]